MSGSPNCRLTGTPKTMIDRFIRFLAAAVAVAVVSAAPSAAGKILYFTSFEEIGTNGVTFVGGPEWQKPPAYPWSQNGNDPMNIVEGGRTGSRSANQAETFSQWSAMRDFGQDLDNFYVKAWVNFSRERERLVNPGVPTCTCPPPLGPPTFFTDWSNAVVVSGSVTAVDDGGAPIPGWPACRLTKPSFTDANTWMWDLRGNSTMPEFTVTVTSGAAAGKQWIVEVPTYYTCGGSPFGTVPDQYWDYSHRLQIKPKSPNVQNPVAAGVKPGDTYEIRGAVAPMYRAIQLWVENRDHSDFAKFGIWHRYTGDTACPDGQASVMCSQSNNWKYLAKSVNGPNFLNNTWTDTGIHRGFNFTGWHSLEIRVYGANSNPAKANTMHYLVDGQLMATAPRDPSLAGFNRMEIGGLAVSQEPAQWDDIEIGFLPEGPEVVDLPGLAAIRTAPADSWVKLPPARVEKVGKGWFLLQSLDRASGVRCVYSVAPPQEDQVVRPGDIVEPVGRVVVEDCERVLYAMNPHVVARNGLYQSKPYWANYRDLRGNAPTMQGQYIKAWGRVTGFEAYGSDIIIDDMSDPNNADGIQVLTDILVGTGDYVFVQGVLGCRAGRPVIYTGSDEDISIVPM